jgi:hypothetical protein
MCHAILFTTDEVEFDVAVGGVNVVAATERVL